MIICSCNVISDRDIRDVVVSADVELCSTAQVYDCLGCLVQCGLCSRSVTKILKERLPVTLNIRGLPTTRHRDLPNVGRCAEPAIGRYRRAQETARDRGHF